jgi:hypothetical protein
LLFFFASFSNFCLPCFIGRVLPNSAYLHAAMRPLNTYVLTCPKNLDREAALVLWQSSV